VNRVDVMQNWHRRLDCPVTVSTRGMRTCLWSSLGARQRVCRRQTDRQTDVSSLTTSDVVPGEVMNSLNERILYCQLHSVVIGRLLTYFAIVGR